VAVGARWGGSCGLGSEQRRAGLSVVMAGGAPRPFIVVGEGHTGRGRGNRPTVMALTPLKAGRLDEGIKGGIKRGNQGGRVKTSIGISMLEAGQRMVAGGNAKER
jgi:hypothetical protein